MRKDAIQLEEKRLEEVNQLSDYTQFHERHRIFPAIFENRNHKRILDISAGVGVVASRIKKFYKYDELVCNDISPTAINVLESQGLQTISFDIDNDEDKYPFPSNYFDAVISLATIEHLMNVDHYLSEIRRILKDGGCFYVSAPNYSGLTYLIPFLITGRTFHNPLNPNDEYEFFAHVKYFTYQTMLEYISTKGFEIDSVYLGVPEGSTKFLNLKSKSKLKAFAIKFVFTTIYKLFSPRWAAEPVLCFRKKDNAKLQKPKKVVL